MHKKLMRNLKSIVLICFIILIVEIIFVCHKFLNTKNQSIYFDGINAIVSYDKYYATVGSNNDNDNHFEKAKISKYNLNKEKTFEKLYNVGYNSSFFGVTMDGSDLVAVGSYEKTSKDHDESIRHALIVKYDKSGNIIFDKDFSVLDNSKFTSIVKVGEDYLVTGQSIYKNTRIGDSEGGAVLAKYDKDGELIWYKTYGSNKSAIFNDLLVINDSIYTVGTDDNSLGIIVKYDMDGNIVSNNEYKTTDPLGFSGIVNIENYIYISGALRKNKTDNDAMIVKYDLDCNYVDQVVYSDDGIERFNKLIVDDEDYLVAIGTTRSPRNEEGISEYDYDGIIAKYDSDLKQIALVTYGDERDDYFTDVIFDNDKYLVVGYSSYEDDSYMSKFISYSRAFKVLGVE